MRQKKKNPLLHQERHLDQTLLKKRCEEMWCLNVTREQVKVALPNPEVTYRAEVKY